MNRQILFVLSMIALISRGYSQEFSEAIEDNSFLIEEAYNQEDRVVQHIFNGYYLSGTRDISYALTQEWPMGSQTHQFSYTLVYQSLNGRARGFGDALINYRYQLWSEKDWCWIAPRLSIILPIGKSADGLGNGVVGVQTNIAASKRWTDEFVSHFNLGATILPEVKGTTMAGSSIRRTLPTYAIGASGIYLASENLNLMVELLWNRSGSIGESGAVEYTSGTIISPGLRYAINIGNLQIVPGLALPYSITSASKDLNVFAYLSFEHPF